jgi:putative cardiolipin synthase
MHNKQMIADNRVAILGGRNIGDEYMGLNAEFNFHDLDVLGVGPVARQASVVFDRYWNSDWVRRIPPMASPNAARVTPAVIELPPEAAACLAMQAVLTGRAQLVRRTGWPAAVAGHRQERRAHRPALARAVCEQPHARGLPHLMRSARREVLITNAYIIPDELFIAGPA